MSNNMDIETNDTPQKNPTLFSVDSNDLTKRAIKYTSLIIFFMIILKVVPGKEAEQPLSWRSIILISLLGGLFYAVIDSSSPTVNIKNTISSNNS